MSGFEELRKQVLDKGLCISCGACIGLCPYLELHRGKVAILFNCDLKQGRCAQHCPRLPIDKQRLITALDSDPGPPSVLGGYRKILASKAGPRMTDGCFQNGGTVSALLVCALEMGFIEQTLVTGGTGIRPKPMVTNDLATILECAGAKYVTSSINQLLNETLQAGETRLGLVGSGCQVTGARLSCHDSSDDLTRENPVGLAIGLFCTWSLDARRAVSYFENRIKEEPILRMDVLPPPGAVFRVTTQNSVVDIPLAEIRPLIPPGCGDCPDMTAEWSDLSVGAFEGRVGWNTVIVRTAKGATLLDRAVEEGFLIVEEYPGHQLSRLKAAVESKRNKISQL